MKAPLSWLRDFVSIQMPVQELAERLALTGTEVERVESVGVPGGTEVTSKYVVGKVVSCEKHPNADKLSVCQVDVGEAEPRTIVCGAPNVAAGQTVGVSLPGAVLPTGDQIREAKLRGVRSSGMILSEAELGFETKSEGTMELPAEWQAGDLLGAYLPIDEQVLEVEVTPNRPDCLSIRGLAREIAAITDQPFEEELEARFAEGDRDISEDVSVEVWDFDLCPRYAARVVRGVTIAESPGWLKARVTHAGMRPINNVVDITNYVMWTIGQPMHAFDLDAVAGRKIIARRARPDERIVTLDGVERTLSEDMLVIADADKPSVIAGIMGSQDSEVTPQTTNILLEAANFHPGSIMRTSLALNLRSESSTRFEKGLDPNLVLPALDLAAQLITEICGGEVSRGILDVKATELEPWEITLRPARVDAILGVEVPPAEVEGILGRLGCNVRDYDGDLVVTVPTFRRDLEREIDLIEEVARIHGLDQLPSTISARKQGRGGLTPSQKRLRELDDVLRGAGLSQVITYSFLDGGWPDRLRLAAEDERRRFVAISNPLSIDQAFMRTMLLPGLLSVAVRNLSVREDRVHIFEVGNTFHPQGGKLPVETRRVGILVTGEWGEESWLGTQGAVDFYLVKGMVERALSVYRLEAFFQPVSEPFLHPGKAALVSIGGQVVGWLGEIHPLVRRTYDLPQPAVAAELNVDLLDSLAAGAPVFEDLLTYPRVEQDLALTVPVATPAESVLREVREGAGDLLRQVRIFDVYEGSQVGEGKKSLALRLTFQSPERTLSDAEINEIRAAIVARLSERLQAQLRS